MGLTILHGIIPYISHIQTECAKYLGIFCGILSAPQRPSYGFEQCYECMMDWTSESFQV